MPDASSIVLVVDDDPDLRESVGRLLLSVGMNARLFASISDFLDTDLPDGPTCLVLDVRFPGQSGLDLQRELAETGRKLSELVAELPIYHIVKEKRPLCLDRLPRVYAALVARWPEATADCQDGLLCSSATGTCVGSGAMNEIDASVPDGPRIDARIDAMRDAPRDTPAD